jgi:HEAT repeat protein
MDRLKRVAISPLPSYALTADYEARESAVDAVAAFGLNAVPTLIEISESSNVGLVKKRALDWIAKLKSSNPKSFPKVIKDLD